MRITQKFQHLLIGFIVGLLFSYGVYRIEHHIKRVGGFTAAVETIGQPAQADSGQSKKGNELTFSKFALTNTVKLGQVTFSYDFVPENESCDTAMQMFIDVAGDWKEFTPSDGNGPIAFHLYKGLDCTGTFAVDLPKGSYTGYRIILFNAPDGKNPDFNHTVWDSTKEKSIPLPKLNISLSSSEAPLTTPTITYPPNPIVQDAGGGLVNVTIPAMVKYPKGYTIEGNGFWVMAKGTGGFAQVWAAQKDAVQYGSADSANYEIPVNLTIKGVKPGVYNVQFGLFNHSFSGSPIAWIFPGLNFEAGGDTWVVKAPESRIPPRLKVANGKFELLTGTPFNFYAGTSGASAVKFVRGGNYGNAITWTDKPALDTPGYFTLLSSAGCHFIRFNFNPDLYLQQHVYQDTVDQVIQNIWAAGLYPVIAMQDLPTADTLPERIDLGDRLLGMVAKKYEGRSVWIEECNEPHEFATWSDWKPTAERYLKTIRSIDPDAFVIVPLENYSKDGAGAAASPITDLHVDLYDGHAYIDPSKVAAAYGPAIKAGLPLLIGEYGATDGQYLHEMDEAFQELSPSPMAISPWAFTIKGQDSLPLVADGSTAHLVLTPAGQAIADDFSAWDKGDKVN